MSLLAPLGRALIRSSCRPVVVRRVPLHCFSSTTSTGHSFRFGLQQDEPPSLASSSTDSEDDSSPVDERPYVSELQDLFDTMEADGPTAVGTLSHEDLAPFYEKKRLDCGVVESALRYRTTSYGGGRLWHAPHVHPNEHRVILTVLVKDLELSETELAILREIVGTRLSETQLQLQSNQFGSRIENKRHLVSMFNRIILACRRMAKEVEGLQGEGDKRDEKEGSVQAS